MSLSIGQGRVYCIGPCVCGEDCHENTDVHTRITGALTSDEWTEEKPCIFVELDVELFECAVATLGAK